MVPPLLDMLADDPADAATLVERLRKSFDLATDDDPESVIAARLEELSALGLVRPA